MTHAFSFDFTCPLPNGLHARPATTLSQVAAKFAASVSLLNRRTGLVADAKSLLSIVGIDVRLDDPCQITVAGGDQEQAAATLKRFVEQELPGCDEPLMAVGAGTGLPEILKRQGAMALSGLPACGGIGQGRLVVLGATALPERIGEKSGDPDQECQRLATALEQVGADLEFRLLQTPAGTEADVLKAHLAILRDPAWMASLRQATGQGESAGNAVLLATRHHMEQLRQSASIYLQQRAMDVQDAGTALLRSLGVGLAETPLPTLTTATIVAAGHLTPQQFLALDRKFLKGLVLGDAGITSHTVILARSFGIPAVAGMTDLGSLGASREALVDGGRGLAFADPTPATLKFYDLQIRKQERRRQRQAVLAKQTGTSGIEIAANIAIAAEATSAFQAGAEGIGLFRTEMLFLNADHPVTEDEQFEHYRQVVAAAAGKPVIIRSLDIGGDKPLPYMALPKEENPFLGLRGLRVHQAHPELAAAQIRAVVRTSAFGPVKFMAPMVATVEEARWFHGQIRQAQQDLASQGIAFDPAMPVGIMVEVPAIAWILDPLCEFLDFFSLGTNDLTQYTQAADRGNAAVASLYSHRHPAMLRQVRHIAAEIKSRNRWVGVCGDMGADPEMLPFLAAMGIDEVSVPASEVPKLQAARAQMPVAEECQKALETIVACATRAEVETALASLKPRQALPLIAVGMIDLETEAASKEELLRAFADRLHEDGRTDDPDAIEAALWAREAVYSTSMIPGFAVPHCKSPAVGTNTLGLFRLKQPVDWQASEPQPVSVAILLVSRDVPGDNAHMKVFAKLARRLMHEGFQQTLATETDPQKLSDFLQAELGL